MASAELVNGGSSCQLSHTAVFVCGIGLGVGLGIILTRRIFRLLVKEELEGSVLKSLTEELRALRRSLDRLDDKLETLERQGAPQITRVSSVKDYVSLRPSSDDDEDEFFEPDENNFAASRAVDNELEDSIGDLELIDKLWNGKVESDLLKAHEILEQKLQDFPQNVELCWRLGRSYFELASARAKMGDLDGKKRYLEQGIVFGKQAVEIDDLCPEAHKWYACLIGSYTDFESTQDQIVSGYKYKRHVERCLELKPTDSLAYHLLGRWCYEVSMLSWWQRKAASALIAEPPNSTVEEALHNFEQAEEISPGTWKSNMLWIGKCFLQQGDKETCCSWLERVLALPSTNDDDIEAHTEARAMMESL